MIVLIGFAIEVFLIGFALLLGYTLLRENERKGFYRLLGLVGPVIVFWGFLLTPLLPDVVRLSILAAGELLFVLTLLGVLLPWRKPTASDRRPDSYRFDERDIMFARARYQPDSRIYHDYYAAHPEKKDIDDQIRSLPPLLSPQAITYHPLLSNLATVSFDVIGALDQLVEGEPAANRSIIPTTIQQPPRKRENSHPVEAAVDPLTLSKFLKQLALHYGALDSGIAVLRPAHIYTNIGRRLYRWGEPVTLDHKYALAFTVPMKQEMIKAAPRAPVIAESTKGYLEAAKIAVLLAHYIRSLGYEARAHIDANYEVIAPLVAAEAGLGELSRMGLLITPRHGPLVRLGVVTTNLPLVADGPRNFGVTDFCNICGKCAENCPSRSIPKGPRDDSEGFKRWKINHESCYTHWRRVGTDCAMCLSSCPYSKPETLIHRLTGRYVLRSPLGRRLALWADDFFYGRYPQKGRFPAWIPEMRWR